MESLHKDNRSITSTCYQHAFTSRLGLPTGFTRGATRLNILQRNPFPLVKKGELKNHIVGFLFWRTFAKTIRKFLYSKKRSPLERTQATVLT